MTETPERPIEIPDDADVPEGHEPEPQAPDGRQDDGRDPEPDDRDERSDDATERAAGKHVAREPDE